jgi:hypothetical protein
MKLLQLLVLCAIVVLLAGSLINALDRPIVAIDSHGECAYMLHKGTKKDCPVPLPARYDLIHIK